MLKISVADERALVMGLSEALKSTEVNAYGANLYELPDGYLDKELEQKLAKYLDRWGVVQFFRDQINRRLADAGFIPEQKSTASLTDFEGFSDTLEVSKAVVATLKTLPWEYTLYVRGPAGLHAGTQNCPLNVPINARFGLISPLLLKKVKFTSGNNALDEWLWRNSLSEKDRVLANSWMYFYYKTSGYIPDTTFNYSVDELEAEIRTFFGCCIATHRVYCFEDYRQSYESFVVLCTNDSKTFRPAGSLSTDVYQALHFCLDEKLVTKFRSSSRLKDALSPVIKAMSLKSDAKLRTAATWIFRSGSRGTDLDRVLETTIALEVLLGDRSMSDKVGLTRLMANRCAYALGRSDDDRRGIMEAFEKFYGLRSQVVHTGKLHMNEDHEDLIDWAVDMASRVFQYELNLQGTKGR